MSDVQFRSHGPSVDTYLWLTLSGLFLTTAVALLVLEPGVETAASAIVIGGISAFLVIPAVYAAWGTVSIERADDDWVVCYQIFGWKRFTRFAVADTRASERCVQNNRGVGTREGLHLLIHVAGRQQPVRIGGGFHLEETELRAIEDLLAPGVNFR